VREETGGGSIGRVASRNSCIGRNRRGDVYCIQTAEEGKYNDFKILAQPVIYTLYLH